MVTVDVPTCTEFSAFGGPTATQRCGPRCSDRAPDVARTGSACPGWTGWGSFDPNRSLLV